MSALPISPAPSTANRGNLDFWLTVILAVIAMVVAHVTDLNEAWLEFAEGYEDYELDEIPLALSIVCIASAWLAWRRWREARQQARASNAANEALRAEVERRAATECALAAAKEDAERVAGEAREANMAKSRFLAAMSHEIRTPMNGVLGMAGLLLDSKLDDDQRQQVKVINASGEALLDLINDLLDLAKVEAGKLELECVDFELPDLVDGVMELLAPRAHGKAIELASCLDAEVPVHLHGDPGRIRQVLLNLVGNAIKFSEEGGVALAIGIDRTDGETSHVRFEIADSGIGIPQEARERLFQNFSQVDPSSTRRFGGTGLGLAICRELVGLMNGDISFESEEGKGSRFWFTIPLRNLNGTNRESMADLARSLADQRVLVVDDTAINCEIWQRSLRALGLEAAVEMDGPSALRAVMAEAFDIVIIDHMMPGMDGVAVARTIRGLDLEHTPWLVLSSSSGVGNSHVQAAELGFDASIPKPLRRATVLAGLQELIDQTVAEPANPDAGPDRDDADAPAAEPAGTSPESDTEAETEPSVRGRVLLVEDNAANQMFMLMALRKIGYRIDVASTGTDAVEMFRKLPYDVVLMDVQMPDMDGLEATQRIRTRHRDRPTPIIALTADAMQGDRERCIEAGMNDYLTKPIDPALLHERIDYWMAETRDPEPALA